MMWTKADRMTLPLFRTSQAVTNDSRPRLRAASALGKISWKALAAAFAAPDVAGRVRPDPQAVAVYADSAPRFAEFLDEQFPER